MISRRIDSWDLAFTGACIFCYAYLLYLGRQNTFWHDEWSFIDSRLPWTINSFMRPHNEHWVLGVALVWKPLLSTVGLKSYTPYLAVSLFAHVLTATAVYRLTRFLAGPHIGFGFGILQLFLGTGAENLFMAFQLGFLGAAAAGTWALAFFLEGRHCRYVALLLVISIATSGPALFFICAVAAVGLFERGRLRQLWVVVPALSCYMLWLVTFGHGSLGGANYGLFGSSLLLEYMRIGLTTATAGVTGLGIDIGLILSTVLIVLSLWRLISRDPANSAAAAGIAGLLSLYMITGIMRVQIEVSGGNKSRYTYLAAIFIFTIVAAWLPRIVRPRLQTLLPLTGVLLWALVSNLHDLSFWHGWFLEQAENTAAALQIAERYGGSPAIPADNRLSPTTPFFLTSIPSPARLRMLTAKYGYPAKDLKVPPEIYGRILFSYVKESVKLNSTDLMSGTAPTITGSANIQTAKSGSCLLATAEGSSSSITIREPGATSIYLRGAGPADVRMYLSQSEPFTRDASMTFALGTHPRRLSLPDLGDGSNWLVRFENLSSGAFELCVDSKVN